MKKLFAFILITASVLVWNSALAAPVACYAQYQGVNCGVGNNVMFGGACAPDAQKADWDAYCAGLTHGTGVYCLGTYAADPDNQPHSCACSTGYAYNTATWDCDLCATGYVSLNGQCMKQESVIYDADKDTIVATEWNNDEDIVRTFVGNTEKSRYSSDGLRLIDSLILTENFTDDYWTIKNDSDKLVIKTGGPTGTTALAIDDYGQMTLRNWGAISTTDYGAFVATSSALDGVDNTAIVLAAKENISSGKVLAVIDDADGTPDSLFTIDGEGQLGLKNWATISTGDYGPFIVGSSAVPTNDESPVFGFMAKNDINDDYLLLTLGHDADGTYDQAFGVDAIGRQYLGNWATITTTDYGAYVVNSASVDGGERAAFTFNARNDITWTGSSYVMLVGDDGDDTFTPLFGINGVGQIFGGEGSGVSNPTYSFLENKEVGMFYYGINDTVGIGLYGQTEFSVGYGSFIGETYQAKSGGARAQGAWTDGAYAHAFQIGNKYYLTNADASLIDVFDGPIMGIGPSTFSGGGPGALVDMFTVGTFTGTSVINYVVEIDGIGTPDTFKWSDDGGATWDATGVAITGGNQSLNNGISVFFRHTTGHSVGYKWEFDGIPMTIRAQMNIKGGWLMGVDASKTDFPGALGIASQANTGFIDSLLPGNVGFVGEGVADSTNRGRGLMGVGKGSSTRVGTGVVGWGVVNDTSDTVNSIGLGGYAWDTHAGGANIGVFGSATGGATNYAFFGFTGDISNSGREIYQPSTTITYASDADITVTKGIMRVAGDGGAVTNIGFADGQDDGQVAILQGDNDTNTVTITDNRNCQLAGAVNMVLGKGDVIKLEWDSGDSEWYEISRSNN